jgi:solute carrier family 25 phosphate transporter 23/24/25/41
LCRYNMVRVAPYGAINFFVYDWCKSAYRRRFLAPGERMRAAPTLAFGGLAGAAAQTVVYPLKMLQRRIQVQGMAPAATAAAAVTAKTAAAATEAATGTAKVAKAAVVEAGSSASAVRYKNMFHGILLVARTEGVGALYAGLLPNYVKIFPAAAVSFYVYETMKENFGIS